MGAPALGSAHRTTPVGASSQVPIITTQYVVQSDGVCVPLSPAGPLAPVGPRRDEAQAPAEPQHAAVVRVINSTGAARSLGSGTLVFRDAKYGVVVTCAHLFRDGAGELTALFPDGRAFGCRLLGIDPTWDLAALLIASPSAAPVAIAEVAPRPGDPLTSCGYGADGRMWCNEGQALQYVTVGGTNAAETIELSGMARQGDSGGPIFNTRAELAGVLQGTNGRIVVGAFCGRVRRFLAAVWPRFAASPENPQAGESEPPADLDPLAPVPGSLPPAAPPASGPAAPSNALPDGPAAGSAAGPSTESLDQFDARLGAVADLVKSLGQQFASRDGDLDEKLSSLTGAIGAIAQRAPSAASGASAADLQAIVQQAVTAAAAKGTGDWLTWALAAAAGGLGIGAPTAGLVLAVRVMAGLRKRRRRPSGASKGPADDSLDDNGAGLSPKPTSDEASPAATPEARVELERRLNDDYARQLAELFAYSGRSPLQDATLGREYDRAVRDAETSIEPTIAKFARQLRDRVERTFHRIHGVSPAPAEPVAG